MKMRALAGRGEPAASGAPAHVTGPTRNLRARPRPDGSRAPASGPTSAPAATGTERLEVVPAAAPEILVRGQILAHRYRLGECIGHGGMAEVYRGTDTALGREVAIKVMRRKSVDDVKTLARLEREARALATLESPHLACFHDLGVHGDYLFLVMRLVPAPPLSRVLAEEGALPSRRAAHIVCQVLEALACMHARGFVHRDVKPSNVLVDRHDRATLVDLGIVLIPSASPLTTKGTVLGTPAYMSPEQAAGVVVDARSDIYSTGVLLMYTLLGHAALRGRHRIIGEGMRARCREIAAPLAAVVDRALELDPARRYVSAHAMMQAVREAVALARPARRTRLASNG